jgi:HAD superfamily hydrolase (TIGR01484 family)
MRFLALATDYDGTLALHGIVPAGVQAALTRLKAAGRKLIMVTGRELEELKTVFPDYAIFDRIVAENGAHVFRPDTQEEKLLGQAPPPEFDVLLAEKGVRSFGRGRVIVATHEPWQDAVLESIHELSLEHQVIFNKGAVMVLPPGINKARGLAAALEDLSLSPRNVVAIGDAENDNALLEYCECGVAVADALPGLKKRADWVTRGGACDGVIELADRMLLNDLHDLDLLEATGIPLGKRMDGSVVKIDPHSRGIMLAGTSGGGKTTFATAFLESLWAGGYQYCVLDPEGDYGKLEHAVVLGDPKHPPTPEEASHVLQMPADCLVLCTLAIAFQDRPEFFRDVLSDLVDLRARTGRPHWLMIDEAHHLLPSARSGPANLPKDLRGMALITLVPSHVNRALLEHLEWVLAVGENPEATLADFAAAIGRPPPPAPRLAEPLKRGEALAWRPDRPDPPFLIRSLTPRSERRRHVRKYSAGELGVDKSFHFRGPEGKLNLRAQNLMLFMQIAEGVDDDTWTWHLKHKDYSRWFRESIKDEELAAEAVAVEEDGSLDPADSRAALRDVIERRYTGPA